MSGTIDLACIGSCCVDIIMNVHDVLRFEMASLKQAIKKYTAIEYSSKLNVKTVKLAPGGSAANVAANLGNMGLRTSFIGKLGNDLFGKMAADDMARAGAEVDVIYTDEDSTAVSVILITPFGKDRSILAYKGANNLIQPSEIDRAWLAKAKNLQWTSLTSDSGVAAINTCIDAVKANDGTIFGCPSISIIKNNRQAAVRLVERSDVLILNKEEVTELTGSENLHEAMQAALDMGPRLVSVTDGANGSYITDGKTLLKAGVHDITVADTTGAGDAFASGVIMGFLAGKDMHYMITYGSAISALECMVLGVRDGIPSNIAAVDAFVQQHPLDIVSTPFTSV